MRMVLGYYFTFSLKIFLNFYVMDTMDVPNIPPSLMGEKNKIVSQLIYKK